MNPSCWGIAGSTEPEVEKDRHNKLEITMIDFARKKAGCQAVRLNLFEVLVRKLCYLLAQKGNPELKI